MPATKAATMTAQTQRQTVHMECAAITHSPRYSQHRMYLFKMCACVCVCVTGTASGTFRYARTIIFPYLRNRIMVLAVPVRFGCIL